MGIDNTGETARPVLLSELAYGARWSLVGQIGTLLFGITLYVLVARLLTPADAGRYFALVSVVAMVSLISQVGQGPLLTKAIAASALNEEPPARFVWRALTVSGGTALIVGTAGGIVVLTSSRLTVPTAASAIAFVGLFTLWTIARSAETLVAAGHRGLGRIGSAAWTQRFGALGLTCVTLFALAANSNAVSISSLLVIGLTTTTVVTLFSLATLLRASSKHDSHHHAVGKTRLSGSVPMWIASVATFGSRSVGIWILALVGSPEQAALFGVAQRLVVPVLLPLAVVNGFLEPVVASLHRRGSSEEMQRVLRFAAAVSSVASVVAAVSVAIFGPALLRVGFGSFYSDAYPLLVALAAGALGSVIWGSPGTVLVMTGNTVTFARIAVAFAVFSTAAAYLGFQASGTLGLAVGVSIATIARFGSMSLSVHRKLDIWTTPLTKRSEMRAAFSELRLRPAVTAHWNTEGKTGTGES